MKENIFIVLQNYFYNIADKEYIKTINRVSLEEDNILTYDIYSKGDLIVISTVNSKNVFLQTSEEPSFTPDKQTKYNDIIEEKVFIKYYGRFAFDKMREIVNKKRHTDSESNKYLKTKKIDINYVGNLKQVKIKVDNNFLSCAVQEAILRYNLMSFENKNYNEIIEAESLTKY